MKKLLIVLFFVTVHQITLAEIASAESNFDGIYTGLAAGRARGEDKGIEYKDYGNLFQGATQRTNPAGSLVSIFAGLNTTVENILIGAEIDYEKRNYSHTTYQEVDNLPYETYPIETKVRNGKSLRARVGYIFNNDKSLAYLTGGFSTINITRTYGDTANTLGNGTLISRSAKHNGYIMGFGAEHFLSEKIFLRAEYRYTRYMARNVDGAENIDAAEIYGDGTIEKQRFRDQSLRVGIGYNF